MSEETAVLMPLGAKKTEEVNSEKVKVTKEKPVVDSLNERIKKGFGLLVIVSFIGWLFYSCGYPHNCEEARTDLASAEQELNSLFRKAESQEGKVTDANLQGAMYAKNKAESKMLNKCYSK